MPREIHGRVIGTRGEINELRDEDIHRDTDGATRETLLRMPRAAVGSRIELEFRVATKTISMWMAQNVALPAPTQHYRLDIWLNDAIAYELKAYNFKQPPRAARSRACST